MEAADAKASPRKDSTEKQPAVEVPSDAVEADSKTYDELVNKFLASSFHSSTSTRLHFFAREAAATGHNTVRFRLAEMFNGLPLTVSSKRPITAIEKNLRLKPSEYAEFLYGVPDRGHVNFPANALAANPLAGSLISSASFDQMVGYGPTVFDANAKDPYGVADVSHVVFPANTHTGSSSSSAPFDQMLGYQFALANPDGALDGGCAVFADPYVAVHGGHARILADEANDARALADEANNVDD